MFCQYCGSKLEESGKFCEICGAKVLEERKSLETECGHMGYSSKINDPAFQRYIKNSNRWAGIFALILAVSAILGFYVYGETNGEMENPQALYIGIGIGSMFLVIAFIQMMDRKYSRTWEGMVVNKTVKNKRRKQSTGGGKNDFYWVDYIQYTVIIRDDKGKEHSIAVDDDTTVFDYYEIGDRVLHHGELKTYEKYDKSRDSYILCNACSSLNAISSDYCFRCKCPLLK